ncbi:MAG: phosphodiester glycosidase family protein [Allorhizobium sp.]
MRSDSYTVCRFDPAATSIRVYNLDPTGSPYRGFAALSRQLWKERHFALFATNGGMYRDDLSPVGLFVEYGIERRPISTKAGWGNFHLLPNGVFFVKGDRAGVLDTDAYLKSGTKPDFATQSGPMLVIDGKLHPKFLADSDSLKRRNGVGVDRDGQVYFAISQGVVRFYDFAMLFRDALSCPNALFLDGTISSVDIPERDRSDRLFEMGPIIAVLGAIPN